MKACGPRAALAQQDGQRLIRACLRGEQSAWDELIDRFGRLVYSIPRRLRLSASDADDVFQTVFTITFRRLETVKHEDRLSAWLIRTTYRECWRVLRSGRATVNLAESLADDGSPTEEELEHLERQQLVRQALDQLDERDRRLLKALFFESDRPDYAQTARRLGMAIGSIGPTRARCFRRLVLRLRALGLPEALATRGAECA